MVRKMIEDDIKMKTQIEKVLDDTGNTENRAAKMDVTDLLKYVFLEIPICLILISSCCYLHFMILEYILHNHPHSEYCTLVDL
jgi:hypothetical protein